MMNSRFYLYGVTILVLSLSTRVSAQSSLDYLFSKQLTNNLPYDTKVYSALDYNYNIITAGSFTSTADFDPNGSVQNATSSGSRDGFIQKLDANGNFLWVKTIAGTTFFVSDIETGSSGEIYIAGYLQGTIDADPSASAVYFTSAGINNPILIKLDENGSYVWAKHFACSGNSYSPAISLNHNTGNIILSGSFTGSIDADPGAGTVNLTSAGSFDGFAVELTSAGNYVQHFQLGSTGSDNIKEIAYDNAGNLVFVGNFAGTVDFDQSVGTSNLTAVGSSDLFITKYNSSGTLLWTKQQSGPNSDFATNVAILPGNEILVAGSFVGGTIDLDPGPGVFNYTNGGVQAPFITKLNPNGDYINSVAINGGPATIVEMAINSENRIIIQGLYENTVDFDPTGGTDNYTSDAFQFDEFYWILNESFVYQEVNIRTSLVSNAQYGPSSMMVRGPKILCSGSFFGTVDFDHTSGTDFHNTIGAADNYLSLFQLCLISTMPEDTAEISSCESYTWPVNGVTYTTNGIYTGLSSGLSGCDSMVAIDLTLHTNPTSNVNQNGLLLTETNTGMTYQWIDCNTNLPIMGATSSDYTVTSNGLYAAVITDANNCKDTSTCVLISDVGFESNPELEFALFPNPANNTVSIQAQNNIEAVMITDAYGRVVSQFISVNYRSMQIDLSKIEAGVYFITIQTSNNNFKTQKLIKN